MQFEIIGQLHEITVTVKLPDGSPVTTTAKGLEFHPTIMTALWVRENANRWELMGSELRGKSGRYNRRRSYWGEIKDLPGWIAEIVEGTTPVEVMTERSS
jgi:hypothetical protein